VEIDLCRDTLVLRADQIRSNRCGPYGWRDQPTGQQIWPLDERQFTASPDEWFAGARLIRVVVAGLGRMGNATGLGPRSCARTWRWQAQDYRRRAGLLRAGEMASVEHKVADISQTGHELNVRAESVSPHHQWTCVGRDAFQFRAISGSGQTHSINLFHPPRNPGPILFKRPLSHKQT
jgi:hypothetical protein